MYTTNQALTAPGLAGLNEKPVEAQQREYLHSIGKLKGKLCKYVFTIKRLHCSLFDAELLSCAY
jgi:hypothetical protein